MTNIAFIGLNTLPLPAVKGGAVETLVQHILDENEKYKKLNITVYTKYDKKSVEESIKYKNVNFIFINDNKIHIKIIDFFIRIMRRLFKVNIPIDWYYINKSISHMKNNNIQKVVCEGKPWHVLKISERLNIDIYLHLHNNNLNVNTKYNKKIVNLCKKIFTVSEYIKKEVVDIDSYIEDKVCVLKNCVDVDKFKSNKEEKNQLRRKYGLKDDDKIILYCGRVIPKKGIYELVCAFKNLYMHKNVKLLIVGDSWYGMENINSSNNEFIKSLFELTKDIKDNVIFTGFLEYKNIPEVYKICDISVVPSLWDEPAGLVVIEGMAAGKPSVVTSSGGITEYTNKECSFIVERDENIINNIEKNLKNLIECEEIRTKMGNSALTEVQKYNIQNYYKEFIRLIV